MRDLCIGRDASDNDSGNSYCPCHIVRLQVGRLKRYVSQLKSRDLASNRTRVRLSHFAACAAVPLRRECGCPTPPRVRLSHTAASAAVPHRRECGCPTPPRVRLFHSTGLDARHAAGRHSHPSLGVLQGLWCRLRIGEPKRMMLPSGSMTMPSCCPHSVSSGVFTSAPAAIQISAN